VRRPGEYVRDSDEGTAARTLTGMSYESDQLDALAGESFRLGDLLDYQDGAIVSRTLINREAATLTVFAVDETQSISEHTAPHDALLQVLDGTAAVTIDGEEYELQAGETLVLPADEPHAVRAVSAFKMLLTMVR